MLASQLLYTSWKNGNSTNKGYMVYSKSRDITGAEENEICSVMKYKAPDNLPYTPSYDEIETLFPKNFAYFKLSSGRFCIAQSSYIGQDYTNRWGNYIIHAYVLNGIGDLVPSRMIGADIFRKRLTEEELNADSAPESLPHVDIEYNGTALTEQEIKHFFDTTSKRETLKALAQSVCNAISNHMRISFVDDLSNMRMWIATLSMIVPKNIFNQVYFSTYATDNSDLITLSCKPITDFSSGYAQSYIPHDLICLDATRNDTNAIAIGCYVDSVCNKLFNDYYEGILCTNNVHKSMINYGCNNFDLAYKLTYVQRGELDYISSNDELLGIIELLVSHETENLSDILEKIFFRYSSGGMYIGDPSSIAVFKALYPHISTGFKADLLLMYVDKKLDNNSDASTIYAEIKKDCPCAWKEAVMHFLRQSSREHLEQHLNSAVALLLCNSWITVYQSCTDEQKRKVTEQIVFLYTKQVASHDTQAILCVLDGCKNIDEQLYFAVYTSVCKTIECFGEDDTYLFQYLEFSLDKGKPFWTVLLYEYNHFPAFEQQYIKHFIALQNKFSAQVDCLMKYADKNPFVRQFVDNVNIYLFKHTQTDSFEDLTDCYEKYLANSKSSKETTDRCRAAFFQKARMFLKNCDEKESIKYSITLYDHLYCGRELVEADKDALGLLADTIYNDNQKDIAFIGKCLSKTSFETIVAFMNSCQSVGLRIPPRAELMREGYLLERAARKDNQSGKKQVQKMFEDDHFLFLKKSCAPGLVKEFLDSYMDVMLKGMYMIYRENNNLKAADLIDYFLTPVSGLYSDFADDVLRAWRKDAGVTNKNMDIYFVYIFEKANAFRNELKDIVEEYLLRMGRGKRDLLFEELIEYFEDFDDASYSKKMNRYIKEFRKKHMSFWDKIKSFLIKEEDKNNGKKK